MGFFNLDEHRPDPSTLESKVKGFSVELLHKQQCNACPLNHADVCTPHMLPSGTKKPLVYMLGHAPSKQDDKRDKHFSGPAGQIVRRYVPHDWLTSLRWNNIVRTMPPDLNKVGMVETECCRPSIIADIERTQPTAIFGFGPAVLAWVLDETHVNNWAGRRIPVKIGTHTCWFFPMLDPAQVLDGRRFTPRRPTDYGSDQEFAFALNIRNAFKVVEDLPTPKVMTVDEAMADVEWVTGAYGDRDLRKIQDWLDHTFNLDVVGFDYETSCLRPFSKGAKLLTVAIATDEKAFAFALRHRESKWSAEHLEIIDKELAYWLRKSRCRKTVQNLAFEQEWSAVEYGRATILEGEWDCTQSQQYLLDERPYTQSLDAACLELFGLRIKGINNLDRAKLDRYPVETVLKYNGMDAKFHLMCHRVQMKRLKAEGLLTTYREHLRRIPTAVLTQIRGVPIDQRVVKKLFKQYSEDLEDIEADIAALPVVRKYETKFEKKFRPSADDDIKKLLVMIGEKLDKTKKELLIKVDHPIADLVLEWRKINKQLSTYITSVAVGIEGVEHSKHVYPDGLMHPIITTNKTRTWRTSSEDPNIQNWTKHGDGKEVRKQVKHPSAEMRCVAIDFAGIQARNVAMESKDKTLVEAYWTGYDVHVDWRERIINHYPKFMPKGKANDKKVLAELRHKAKNQLVFPTFFGAQKKTIANGLGIPENVAEDLREEFFDMFPDIKAWHEEIDRTYFKEGYVTGLSGFRRRAPISSNQRINSPIQADESIIVCAAWERMSRLGDPRMQPNFMIHDDLSWFWHKDDLDHNIELAVKTMVKKEYPWINVPIGVEVSVGVDWYSLEGIGEYQSTKDGGVEEVKKKK